MGFTTVRALGEEMRGSMESIVFFSRQFINFLPFFYRLLHI